MDEFNKACADGNLELVQQIFENPEQPIGAGKYLDEALFTACKNGHLNVVKYLVEHGARRLDWALLVTCVHGHLPVVKYLVDQGADNFDNALCHSYGGGHLHIVEYLTEFGGYDKSVAMTYASINGQLESVKRLVEKEKVEVTPEVVMSACRGTLPDVADNLDVIKYLVPKCKILVEPSKEKHEILLRAFYNACHAGRDTKVHKYLIEQGVEHFYVPDQYFLGVLNNRIKLDLMGPRVAAYIYRRKIVMLPVLRKIFPKLPVAVLEFNVLPFMMFIDF